MQRRKTPHCVVTFQTTSDAMAVQAAADRGLVPGRAIPVPSEISAGCGLAWCAPLAQRGALKKALDANGLAFAAMKQVDLY